MQVRARDSTRLLLARELTGSSLLDNFVNRFAVFIHVNRALFIYLFIFFLSFYSIHAFTETATLFKVTLYYL